MGSIPATLDILLQRVWRRISKTTYFKPYLKSTKRNIVSRFHAQNYSANSYNIFFSYKSLALCNSKTKRSFDRTFNFFQYKTNRFMSFVSLYKWSAVRNEPHLWKSSLVTSALGKFKFHPTHSLLNIRRDDYFELALNVKLLNDNKTRAFLKWSRDLYYVYRLKVYLDNMNSLHLFLNFRTLQNSLQFATQSNWYLHMFFEIWIILHKHLHDFNLQTKSQFRQYFKFYNYWFEYSRLSPFSYFERIQSKSVFSMSSIGLNSLSKTNFYLTRLSFRTDVSELPHTLLRHTLFKRFSKSSFFPRTPSALCKVKNLLWSRNKSQDSSICTYTNSTFNDASIGIQRGTSRTISFSYNLRSVFWNRRQQSYLFRNRSWKLRFKSHQIYRTSFRWSRKLRKQNFFRKVIPKIVRKLLASNFPVVTILYRSLVFTQTLAHLLTTGSSSGSYRNPVYFRTVRRSNLYIDLNNYTKQAFLYLIHEPLIDSSFSNVTCRQLAPIRHQTWTSDVYILPFASSKFFVSLLTSASLITWKYSLAFSLFVLTSRLVVSSSPKFIKFLSQTLNNILLSQAYGYNSNSILRYITYSNLSILKLDECSQLTSIRKFIDSKVLRYYSSQYMRPTGFFWYYTTLIQFLEDITGRRVVLNFGPFLETALTFSDRAHCLIWGSRILGFQRILGPKIFIHEALEVLVTSIRLKDPTFLANWIRAMLIRISFWKYRLIFRYLKFLLHNLMRESFRYFNFKGAKFRLKGKISVAGNARTRMILYRVGSTTHTTMSNRVSYDLSYVNTFTGIQGFKIWFFY